MVKVSSVTLWRAKGSGAMGSGCVADAISPGTLLVGYCRFEMGKSGVPFQAIKDLDVTGFCGLSDRIDCFAVSLDTK